MDKQQQLDDFFGLENKDKDSLGNKIPPPKPSRKLSSILKLLPKILSKRERYLILGFLIVIAGSLISIPISTYLNFTTPIADNGGSFQEGIIGEPRHINPLLSQSDADRDLVRLIYSGLLEYNNEGKLVPALAESYEISSDELNYTVYLKKNALWHDNIPVTADDVIFTIQAAQNVDYGSFQRINWQGVEIEKADSHTIIFKLKNKYAQFLNNLTIPILPLHVWENVKPINFALSEFNLKPIGSGPYQFKKLQKDKTGRIQLYELASFEGFYEGPALIEKIQIKFYESEDALINAYNNGEVDNIGFISSKNLKKLKFRQRLVFENIKMPRYFAAFFNQNQSKILSDKNVRLALAHGTNKEGLIQAVLENNGIAIDSPMIGEILDINKDIKTYNYDKAAAEELLKKSGWETKDENGILTSKDEKLSIKLTTSTWPELIEAANFLKDQWRELGIEVNVEVLPNSDLQQAIKERNYQMLLFGEILNLDPDPFSLWHSSQKRDPGLNLSLYDNKAADTLLEDARKTLNPSERIKKYDDLQKLIIDDVPALFLYSPAYIYGHTKRIRGFETKIIGTPSDRFIGIERWFIETRRVWK